MPLRNRPPPPPATDFAAHFERATTAVRVALTDLLANLGGSASVALSVAREIGIDKTLAWRMLRLVRATDPYEAIAHVPGPTGLRILIESFEQGGAEPADLKALRAAAEGFDAMVTAHAGDRPTLDLILVSSAPGRMDGKQLQASRRQAFRGTSAIWGVQARARYLIRAIAPSTERPELADVASIAGFLDFRRLRPITGWPLLHLFTYGGARPTAPVPMTPADDAETPLLDELSAGSVPHFETTRQGEGIYYTLPVGPVGNAGMFSCAFGWLYHGVGSVYRNDGDQVAENSLLCNTPVELLQFDLLVHRSIPLDEPPDVHLESKMPVPDAETFSDRSQTLPLVEKVIDLGAPPLVSSPHVPRYAETVQRACASLGRPVDEFHGYRVVVRYPAVPTRLVLTFPLPERP